MASVNKVILVGNLGSDVEIKKTTGGKSVANFSVATTEKFNDASGARQEKTEWHNITMWGKVADLAAKYLKKGSAVYLEGKNETQSWVDKNGGGKKYKVNVVCHTMQFLGGKSPSSSNQSSPKQSQGFDDERGF